MQCVCGEKVRLIGNEMIGFLICCPSLEKCGLNSDWQPTREEAILEFKKAIRYGNRNRMEKQCKTCGDIKNISEFYRSTTSRDGYFNICKQCHSDACKKNQATRKARGIA